MGSLEEALSRLNAERALQRSQSLRKLKSSPPSFKNGYGWTSRHQKDARLTLMCGFITILMLRGSIGVSTSEFMHINQSENPEHPGSSDTRMSLSSYRLGPQITDWDEQRAEWNLKNPGRNTTRDGKPRVLLASGSQPTACKSSTGDHLLLKSLKNKVDYGRLHDMEVYYNMVIMHEEMDHFWIKLPTVRKMMLSHPEVEWIWWMDSDAMITDMSFEIPLQRYADHNMVVHGFPWKVFDDKDWCGLNAGVFLIRNNQWALDFLDLWAPMGEKRGDNRDVVGHVLSDSLTGRPHGFEVDDQSALIFLLNTLKDVLSPKIFLEHSYYLHGFWAILSHKYEEFMQEFRPGFGDDRWPFVTHFVGCKTCSGEYGDYDLERCTNQMERAFNFADNQVLQLFGFQHTSLRDSTVTRVRNDTDLPLKLLSENLWTNKTILF